MAKDKVIHARIDDEMHDMLIEKCNELGCNITDYFESVLRHNLENDGIEEESKPEYDLELNLGKIRTKNGKFIGYLKGFNPENS